MKKFLLILGVLLMANSVQASNLPVMQLFDGQEVLQTDAKHMVYKTIPYMKANNYNQALTYINTAIQVYPKDPQAYFLRSQINLALNNLPAALDDVNTALETENNWKLYAWRAYLYLKCNDEKNIENIKTDINIALKRQDGKIVKVFKGYYNNYIWAVMDDTSISSNLKNIVYKYLMQYFNNDKVGNEYTVPVIASYIQYIYSLDDNDDLFKILEKDKSQILKSYTDAFEASDGQYTKLIVGILTVASGDIQTGSEIIYEGFANINPSHLDISQGKNMLYYSMNIIKPKIKVADFYGLGVVIQNRRVVDIVNQDLITKYGIKLQDRIIAINDEDVTNPNYYNDAKICKKLIGDKNSKVLITFGRGSILTYKTYKVMIERTFPVPIKKYEYYKFPKYFILKNGRYYEWR